VNPVVCGDGHLFCRECILQSLLTQAKQIEAATERFESAQQAAKVRRTALDSVASAAAKQQFIATANSVAASTDSAVASTSMSTSTAAAAAAVSSSGAVSANPDALRRDLKRKKQEETASRGVTCFWAHSEIPEAPEEDAPPPPSSTMCPEGEHALKMKHLVSVIFKTASGASATDTDRFECPSCLKVLKNGVECTVIKSCGHAMCATCLATQDNQCFVCEKPFKSEHVIPLKNRGTGFAGAGGQLTATKQGVQFIG
jgi:nitric oxide synthase-interacting protein